MSTTIPSQHIDDSQKLIADGMVTLFEITPAGSTGVIRVKSDDTVTWQGFEYTGIPIAITGEKRQSDSGLANPRLTVGQDNIDISLLKPLVFDGSLDNARIKKITVLSENLKNNLNVKEEVLYRVKRVESYTRTRISLILATYSDSLGFELPYKSYESPDFPAVLL